MFKLLNCGILYKYSRFLKNKTINSITKIFTIIKKYLFKNNAL